MDLTIIVTNKTSKIDRSTMQKWAPLILSYMYKYTQKIKITFTSDFAFVPFNKIS